MEKLAIICMIFVIGLISCEQQEDIRNATALETAKTSFKRSEPAEFTFKSDAPPNQIKWSVSPEKNVTITADGYTARILFSDPGRYQVTATDSRTTSRTFVNVDTLSYNPGDTTTIPTQPEPPIVNPVDTTTVIDTVRTHDVLVSLEGDELTFTPSIVDSLMGNGIELQWEEVFNRLNRLPPATRAICSLYYLENFTVKEIGQEMNIKEGTVKWHLNESRNKIRDGFTKNKEI